jgi:hypothetical protein
MSIYEAWGFHESPFNPHPLKPDERGKTLLVGRDEDLRRLRLEIESGPQIPTLGGGVGSGKTSLANVCAFDVFRNRLMDAGSPLIVPCRKPFQIEPEPNLEKFTDDVLFEVAQTFIENADLLARLGSDVKNRKALDEWLNSPTFREIQGGVSILSTGLSGGQTTSANVGHGFDKSGFRRLVFDWLKKLSSEGKGGIVCIIDNLELLERSTAAQRALEVLRDPLLMAPGLKWVLCGANGIIESVVASPRLSGILYPSIELSPIKDNLIEHVFASRVEAFQTFPGRAYLPITLTSFGLLYDSLGRNLRNLLNYANTYCMHIAQEGRRPESDNDKDSEFFRWFEHTSRTHYEAVEKQLTPRAWRVFDRAIELNGKFSPSNFANFGFQSVEALRPYVKNLEDSGLLQSAKDDQDQRRKSIEMTPKGYLVNYHRRTATSTA